jgi:NarL family two-component system response regulator LiaR
MNTPISILIVDDHKIVREGLKTFLKPILDLTVAGEACDGVEAVRLAASLQPDVILLDLVMPNMDGIEAASAICRENPKAHILMITSFSEDERVVAALQVGALGYLLKDSSPQELETAIRTVSTGDTYLPSRLAQKVIQHMNQPAHRTDSLDELTPREKEVVKFVGMGRSNDEIAASLYLSIWTVRTYLWRIMKKLQLESRTQVALYAVRSEAVPQRT